MPPRRLRALPLVLPAPRGRADRAGQRVPPAAPRSARPAVDPGRRGVPAHRRRPVQEGRDLELRRHRARRPGVRRARRPRLAATSCSASTATPSRSTPTSPATPTSPSAARCCSASGSRRTSTRPYRALSIQDFWRRWHMTLSRWLRDYLYIPLGGSRGGVRRTYRNLFLTMLLGGLWHGAAWTFVVWGAIHGGYLVVERCGEGALAAARGPTPRPVAGAVTRPLQWFLTFHVVCLGWVFFRADSVGTAFDMIGGILASAEPNGSSRRAARRHRRRCRSPASSCPTARRAVQDGASRASRPALQVAGLVGRPHRHRRPRPRRRRPVHLLPVLTCPARPDLDTPTERTTASRYRRRSSRGRPAAAEPPGTSRRADPAVCW